MIEQDCLDIEEGCSQEKNSEYSLLLSEEILSEVKHFSQRYCMSESNFVAIMLKLRLEGLKYDIEEQEFTFLEHYLECSQERKGKLYNKLAEEKTHELKIYLDTTLATAIELYCEIIRWLPERFIEDILEFWIEELNTRIDMNQLGFLNEFFDFNPIVKTIDKVISANYRRGGARF